MTTKLDLLYDEVKRAIDYLYSEEYDDPTLQVMFDEAINEFIDNIDDIVENGDEYKQNADDKYSNEMSILKDFLR